MTIADFLEKHFDVIDGTLAWVIFAWTVHRLACAWRAFWSVMK